MLIGAYLRRALPDGVYIHIPGKEESDDFDGIIPEGPRLDPQTLVSDEILFKSYYRHSDFDFVSLTQDRNRALQFLRWKTYVNTTVSPIYAAPKDIIRAATNGFLLHNKPINPYYQIDDLPTETLDYITSIKRMTSPDAQEVMRRLMSSASFELELMQDLTPQHDNRRLCRTYTCHLSSLDGQELHNPPLHSVSNCLMIDLSL